MTRLVLNRDGGKTDEFGHILGLSRFMQGEVIEGLEVTAQSSPNMTVKVSAGSAKIPYGTGGTRYDYWVANDADYNVTIATADPANPRIDYVIGVVDRTVTPSTGVTNNSNNMFKIIAVAGTPAASPSVPTGTQLQTAAGTGNPYIILRRVNVGAGITQITAAQIGTDMRQFTYAGRLTADGLINTALIADLAVTNQKIANNTVQKGNIDWTTSGGIWWEEIGRASGTSTDSVSISLPITKKYMQLRVRYKAAGTVRSMLRFNSDSGNNYAQSYELHNGNAYGADQNVTGLQVDSVPLANNDTFSAVIDIVNIVNEVKRFMISSQISGPSASNISIPGNFWSTWVNNSQINQITLSNTSPGDFANIEVVVLGHD